MTSTSSGLQAAIFDMDGVITRTASLHAAAWKLAFDQLFARLAVGRACQPFDEQAEYRAYVDGKPRREGVRSVLRAREIELSPAEEEEIARHKDELFERFLQERGVETFPSTIALIEALRQGGVKTGVVTSSRHGRQVLDSAGIAALFDVCLDGIDLDALGLKGKPDPDIFLHAAHALDVTPGHAVVVEDAVAGVQAGHRGGFALVVGVDRGGNAAALRAAGADVVVPDLASLPLAQLEAALSASKEKLAWRIEAEGFDLARERQMESLFALGNGYMGVRGALDSPLPGSQSDLFVAGVYDAKQPGLPYSEFEFFAPERGSDPYAELVPLPSPLRLQITVADTRLDFDGGHGRELRRVLDMRGAILHIEAAYETPGGRRTLVRTRRCASLDDPHLLLQDAVVTPENHWEATELRTSPDVPDLAEQHPHLERIEYLIDGDIELVRYRTHASQIEVCIVSRIVSGPNFLRCVVSVFTSRDTADPKAAALAHSRAHDPDGIEKLFQAHAVPWANFWGRADIRVPGHPDVEQALRFNSYHLRSAAGNDPRVSIGARTLSGRAYEGHVFWDAEIFMLPFFLHVDPALARNLLLYRHSTLEGARRRARELGYAGACFAWESTVTGNDLTPAKIVLKSSGREIPIFTGTQQIHITADIAYAAWRYWEATGDEEFLAGPGADLLFETARFWASRVTPGEQHHHIRGVVGPDEYHHSVNDNAYTNWMARFNLERAAWVAQHHGTNLAEAGQWGELARTLFVPEPDERGVIEQFEGFFDLAAYPLRQEEQFHAPVSRLFDWERINGLKLIKQADVLMLPVLFPQAFTDDVVAANYRYYEPLTDHGSSLSPSVHAAIAARIGLHEDALRYWKQSLWLDLSNKMDNSALGVHAAAMAGTWQALVFGFLGVVFDETGPHPDAGAVARLPGAWDSLQMTLAWRGCGHPVGVTRSNDRRTGP
ncbi:beta-phosphoglucomutase family hydrolase [Lacisediminimonas profundi]|uniref:beta-phosphoglucomutase family hydrolase n=1 Tax=Lacisediminimonas profundi TaxID=2603856 RepID=UPI00124B8D90|nr:beta-phosphoglucomutase family hydrolase [Lacisediminimonas profundi]